MTPAIAEDRAALDSSATGYGWLPGLAVALAVAAAIELLLLRVATRTLIHIPGVERAEGPFTLVAELGRLTYSITVVLLAMLLVAIGLWSARAGRTIEVAAVAAFGLAAMAARLDFMDPLAVVSASIVAVVVLGVAAARRHPTFRRRPAARVPLLLIGAAIVLFGLRALSVGAMATGVVASDSWLLQVAEMVALAGLILLPLATGRPDRVSLVAALVVGLSIWVGLTLAGATVKILFLWNLGLAGSFPAWVYALGGAAVIAAALTAARSGRTVWTVAIVLLVAGGFVIQSTYQSALIVASFGVLATADAGWLRKFRHDHRNQADASYRAHVVPS
jgi:hypothetical protein